VLYSCTHTVTVDMIKGLSYDVYLSVCLSDVMRVTSNELYLFHCSQRVLHAGCGRVQRGL